MPRPKRNFTKPRRRCRGRSIGATTEILATGETVVEMTGGKMTADDLLVDETKPNIVMTIVSSDEDYNDRSRSRR
jgi:hypothetical protein